jgi:hypothetical protein
MPIPLIPVLTSTRTLLLSQIEILRRCRIPFPLIESRLVRISIEQVEWLAEIHQPRVRIVQVFKPRDVEIEIVCIGLRLEAVVMEWASAWPCSI